MITFDHIELKLINYCRITQRELVIVSHSLFVIFVHFKNDAIEQSKIANKDHIEPTFRQRWRGIENASPPFDQHNYL